MNGLKRFHDALPFLKEGAFFVLEREVRPSGRIVSRHRMRLMFSCGRMVEGCWNYAKREADRKRMIEGFYFGKNSAWKLRSYP